ncbi:MAG TPA: rhodanese-like domain-containing protein [Thermoanaerobaculia bacterium]|nr:rhodanese-like domain-containing protein [Thermoanaerobaculia bacterium]
MKSRTCTLVLACLTVLISTAALAATPRDSIVVTADWLAKHVNDPDLVLLHVGDKASYEAGHIAGARLVSPLDVSVSDESPKGLILEMPPAEVLHKELEGLGISDKSRIILYYVRALQPASRILITLQYAGLGSHASILDGGLPAWERNNGALTKEATPARTGTLAPLKIQPLILDAATVRSRIGAPGYAIVDGRASVYYDGVETAGSDTERHRTGHIHGALSIPFTSIIDDKLMIKSDAELLAMFTKAGVKPGDTVIGYCHIGLQTTAMLLAARLLGHPVLLYDGSFQDWSRHPDYPVDNPSEKAAK